MPETENKPSVLVSQSNHPRLKLQHLICSYTLADLALVKIQGLQLLICISSYIQVYVALRTC